MKELLEEAAILLSDVNNFGADDSVRRAKISMWLAKYEAAKQSVQADLGYCPVPNHVDYIQGVDGVRYCLACHRPIR